MMLKLRNKYVFDLLIDKTILDMELKNKEYTEQIKNWQSTIDYHNDEINKLKALKEELELKAM